MKNLFDIWIQHIKAVGKQSTLTNHMITYTRNKFITNFTAVTNDDSSNQNTYYFIFDDRQVSSVGLYRFCVDSAGVRLPHGEY